MTHSLNLLALLFLQAALPFQQTDPFVTAKVNGRPLPLTAFKQGDFAQFELARPMEIELRAGFDVRWVEVRPKSAGIVPVIGADHATVRFTIKNPAPVTVEFNDDLKHVLHLFAYAPEKDAPAPDAPNVRYFGPGLHEPGLIELKDGETLYLAPGAWVKGNVRSIGTRNVAIRGRGVLDGSFLMRGATPAAAAAAPADPVQPRPRPGPGARNMIYLERTEGAKIEGITVFNSQSWTVYLRQANGTRIDGVRILNPSDSYGDDGFDIVSSSNVTVENVFVRTNDDCVVVKNSNDVDTHDIVVRKAVFWNMPTGGNAVEVGFELRSQPVRDIRFEDIDIIHVERGAAISIHNGDSTTVQNVVFDNIRVEDVRRKLLDFAVVFAQYGPDRPQSQEERTARMDRGGAWDGLQRYTAEEQPERAKFRGHIRNIVVRNLHVVDGALPYSVIAGFDAEHAVEDVTVEGLTYLGRPIRSAAEGKFAISQARGVVIK
jgi:hypothetical protein